MKNKSKSFSNFIRRELNESEKLLLNKYNNNEKDTKQVEIKNKDYLNITYNNKLKDYNFAYENKENISSNYNDIYKNIKPQINKINNIEKEPNKYKNNYSVNYNYLNLTESLLKKTQNIFSPSKKTNLKASSCKNIFDFKRITKKENKENINKENIDIPELIEKSAIFSYKDKKEEKKLLEDSNKKLKHNYSDINLTKKKVDKIIPKLDTKKSSVNDIKYKKYLFDKISLINTKMIKPYIYYSSYNNKKITVKKIKNFSQIDINNKDNKALEIIKGYKYNFDYNDKYELEKKEFKKSFLQHSSIMSELINKNEK